MPAVAGKERRSFEHRHLKVSRSARYAMMGSFDADLSEVWFVCHGQGQLAARFLSRFLPLERDDRLFIAPEALSRYYLAAHVAGPHRAGTPVGAIWMTSEDREREIDDYVSYLDLLHHEVFSKVARAEVKLWVLGFSQGVSTAARWVVRGKVEPDRVVLCSGVFPPEVTAADATRVARQSPVTIAFGSTDEFATPELVSAQKDRLDELGVDCQLIGFEGGHEITPEFLARLTRSGPTE
ncbi:MAG: alpha/beta hydrolase [Gemmatimonadaceae bacterium]